MEDKFTNPDLYEFRSKMIKNMYFSYLTLNNIRYTESECFNRQISMNQV